MLAAAIRIARAEEAVLVPAYLLIVPLRYGEDSPLKDEVKIAMPLLEAVEHAALRAGVAVDARIEKGRTLTHALRRLWEVERFDRIVAPGAGERRRRLHREGARVAPRERADRDARAEADADRAAGACTPGRRAACSSRWRGERDAQDARTGPPVEPPRRARRLFVGRPMQTHQAEDELLPISLALPIFAADAISSVAYATEAAMVVLLTAGLARCTSRSRSRSPSRS